MFEEHIASLEEQVAKLSDENALLSDEIEYAIDLVTDVAFCLQDVKKTLRWVNNASKFNRNGRQNEAVRTSLSRIKEFESRLVKTVDQLEKLKEAREE